MSTTMTELDRQAAVAVFRASLPRRGAKGRNDRLFLEALHHHLASAAEALRQMERRVEAVRAVEQGSRLRDVLRPSGLVQFIGTSGADVRFHRGSRPCLAHLPQCDLLISS